MDKTIPTRAQIEALCNEAYIAGNAAVVEICDCALNGTQAAVRALCLRECARLMQEDLSPKETPPEAMRRRAKELDDQDENDHHLSYSDLESEMACDVDVSSALRWCANWIENVCID